MLPAHGMTAVLVLDLLLPILPAGQICQFSVKVRDTQNVQRWVPVVRSDLGSES